jgi:mono/diheme cytochrome c family protein
MRSERYQIALISLGVISTALFAFFLYREIFPEYKIYQEDYVALEKFRSTYTGEAPPQFKMGVKQIVFEREDKGPAKIDRCTSCHVAIQLPHFSPTKIAYDVNGNIERNADGSPVKVLNEEYVWAKLDQKIAELKDAKVNEQLIQEGNSSKVAARTREAQSLEALKVAKVDHQVYDVTKVLSMHPLIGKETRPFEFHPLEEYGCTSCHSGNGRGLTTEKAHGPVFDGQYEAEFMGYKPQFTEKDEANDPRFSKVFNEKPGDSLLFQTTPILVGNLIQSSCVQCHKQTSAALQGLTDTAGSLVSQWNKKYQAINESYENEKDAVLTLLDLRHLIAKEGIAHTIEQLKKSGEDPIHLPKQRAYFVQQLQFLQRDASQDNQRRQTSLLQNIDRQLVEMLGTQSLVDSLQASFVDGPSDKQALDKFISTHQVDPQATGSLFEKLKVINLEKSILKHIEETHNSLSYTSNDANVVSSMTSDIDWLTKNYHRGQQLYLSQACYACHRIAGMARGGVGPELTQEGNAYPWFIKESIVWPQADLRTSTMPNFMLDHVELEDLMTFLLAQKGPTAAVSQTEYKLAIQEWEAGRKMAWEKPIPSSDIHNVHYGMTVFATEGCASCHRLEGYQSDVGFRIEKEGKPNFEALYQEREWFRHLFPENIQGSALIAILEKHAKDIDQRIIDHVREGSILEELEKQYPETIESFYSSFRFASRAKNNDFVSLANESKDPQQKNQALADLKAWQERVRRVLMMYIQEYGLGRLVGPRPNWSGIYRSNEWLMEHFYNPTGHVARSIMPVFPFDESKFASLTYMLDVLGKQNRDAVRAIWDYKGFQPERAYQIYCSACHGDYMQGNGPIANWIYPIPKNLRNAEFLRNLTRENVIQSITHGVKGTPMPPWGESPQPKPEYDGIPVLTNDEILKLVDWLYSSLPGGTVIRGTEDVPKWHYQPKDVLEELRREGNTLQSDPKWEEQESGHRSEKKSQVLGWSQSDLEAVSLKEIYYAALEPQVSHQKLSNPTVEDVFEEEPNPISNDPQFLYYIKKKYYIKENLQAGQDFFEHNCAACHGREADGSGARASIMFDAKPRMLTNLDWIKTRDDMRLLQSIKYGVPGTAMTPWGDLTSSLQRLQLVMFIRSLSAEKEKRDELTRALYASFGQNLAAVEELRIQEYPVLDALQQEIIESKAALTDTSNADSQNLVQAKVVRYQKQLEIEDKVHQAQAGDQLLIDLKAHIAKEREIYQIIGNDMISADVDQAVWGSFLELINLNQGQLTFKDGKLSLNDKNREKLEALAQQISSLLSSQEKQANQEITVIQGKFPSSERDLELKMLQSKISMLSKMNQKLLSGFHESVSLKEQEKELFEQIPVLKS